MWLEIIYRAHGAGGEEIVYHDLGPGTPSQAWIDELVEDSAPSWMRDLSGYTVGGWKTMPLPPPAAAHEERKKAESRARGALQYLQRFYREVGEGARALALDGVMQSLRAVLDTRPTDPREEGSPLSSNGQDAGL